MNNENENVEPLLPTDLSVNEEEKKEINGGEAEIFMFPENLPNVPDAMFLDADGDIKPLYPAGLDEKKETTRNIGIALPPTGICEDCD